MSTPTSVTGTTPAENALLEILKTQTTNEGWLSIIKALALLGTSNKPAYEAQIKEHLDKEASKKTIHVVVGHPGLPPGMIIGPTGIAVLHDHIMGGPVHTDIFGRPLLPGVYFR